MKHTLGELKQMQSLPLRLVAARTARYYLILQGGYTRPYRRLLWMCLHSVEHNLSICSVYGDVVEDYGDNVEGQTDFFDFGVGENHKVYKTTGCERKGCMLCGFGCHLDKSPNRFELLKESHPKMYALMDKIKNNGVSFREAIEWLNENGGTDKKL